jgi:hypothetical protein
LSALFCGLLFQLGDAAVQTVDIVGGPEAGLLPRLFTEMFGQALAELGVFAGQTDAAGPVRKWADLMATGRQFYWPSVGNYVAAYGQFFMAANR